MNPSNKEASGTQLPEPGLEPALLPAAGDVSRGLRGGAERPASAEQAPGPSAAPPLSTIPLPQSLQPVQPTAPPADGAAPAAQAPALPANDNDLIEKEWVNKAKQIVERTRNDPYKQSEDLTLFKADYIKKRYGKTIKVSQ